MRRVENTEMNQTRGFIEALRLILATPGPSQIPWMRIKPLGSRWEVMNLPSLQAWKSGLLLWSAKWWETPEQRKSRTSTPTNKASKASGPHFQLPMAAAAPEDSLFPRFPFSQISGCSVRSGQPCTKDIYLSPQSSDQAGTECSKILAPLLAMASPLLAMPITQSHAGTFHPHPGTKA